jgi:Aminotransferase class I and II
MQRVVGDYDRYTQVYPAGLPELRDALTNYYNEAYNLSLSHHNIIIGCGTSSLFRNLFQILAAPGDEVLLALPYYPLYNSSPKRSSAPRTWLPCRAPTSGSRKHFGCPTPAADMKKASIDWLNSSALTEHEGHGPGTVLTEKDVSERAIADGVQTRWWARTEGGGRRR